MNQPTSNGNPHDLIDHCRFVGRTRIAWGPEGSKSFPPLFLNMISTQNNILASEVRVVEVISKIAKATTRTVCAGQLADRLPGSERKSRTEDHAQWPGNSGNLGFGASRISP
jgi:hypothetical protein